MATAIIVALAELLKAELEYLCTPEGQKEAARIADRLQKLRDRIDWLHDKIVHQLGNDPLSK